MGHAMLETGNNKDLEKAKAFGFQPLDEFRREHIEHALLTAGNDVEKAAALLGVPLKALQRCMHKLRISRGTARDEDS